MRNKRRISLGSRQAGFFVCYANVFVQNIEKRVACYDVTVLGVLNAAFVGEGTVLDATFRSAFNVAADNAVLSQAMTDVVSKAEALAFMCACTFNIPCVMALSTTYRESHSLKWTARIAAFYVCGALILACIVYHIAALFL